MKGKAKYLSGSSKSLTKGKIYEVLEYGTLGKSANNPGIITIRIEDDFGSITSYLLNSYLGTDIFEDATEEYRNDIIDYILK